jgi:glycosyltransferase involved in cell wall biosynthesis
MILLFDDFNKDPYPGSPKVLFIGLSESTHTRSWIDLLDQSELNVRLFGLPSGIPPEDWHMRTYITHSAPFKLDSRTRARLYSPNQIKRYLKKGLAHYFFGGGVLEERWLMRIIRQWRPNIIHTLGLDPASCFYWRTRNRFNLDGLGMWVLQLRGGSDLALSRLDPIMFPRIRRLLCDCNQLLSDNQENYRFASEIGVKPSQIASLGTVPGTGGVDVSVLSESWRGLPSARRIILWPKAYDSPWSKALPVIEAIKLIWHRIQPCQIYMLAVTPETRMWYWTLPEAIRQHCHVEERIPRDKVLELMVQARVMLAPSLVDGTPNTMFEAMAAGAFPILSPLGTIRELVENERNVLFAHNLYPHEIAEALCRAMSDDALIDKAAERNLELVGMIADRSKIRPRIVEFYERLAKEEIKQKPAVLTR